MAAVTTPTKFVKLTNSHLVCSVCNNVYNDPVINIKCGHTFCRECVLRQTGENNTTKCPVDAVTCDLGQLVVNKAVESQVHDLEIYCRHGLSWSNEKGDHVLNPGGCNSVIKYGERRDHEDVCEFAVMTCPNNEKLCGKFKKKDLVDHLQKCQQYSCPHRVKGCNFIGAQVALASHAVNCGFRGLQQAAVGNHTKVTELEASNKKLFEEVSNLTRRLETLEKAKLNSEAQLESCMSLIQTLQEQYKYLQEKVERHSPVRRSLSALEPKRRSVSSCETELVRSPSASGGYSRFRIETWTMPLQFKCIGTLRGHRDSIWSLKTRNNWLFSAGDDAVIKVWNLEDLTHGCQQTLTGHTDKVQVLATSDTLLYSGGKDLSIRAWSIKERTLVKTVEKAHDDIIAAMVATSQHLFSSSHQVIKVWDANTLEPVHTIGGLYHWVRSLALSTQQDQLFSGSHNTIEIWDVQKFCQSEKITHTYGSVHALAVTEKHIIAGTYNQNIAIFDVSTKELLQRLRGHVGVIMSLCVSLSGRFLFSASSDLSVQLWSLENMLPIQTLQRHEGSVNCLVLHNDLMLSGSEDREIKVFKYFKMQPGFIPTVMT